MESTRSVFWFRVAGAVGAIGLVLWGALWVVTFRGAHLPYGEQMWLRYPWLGADFWSQSAYGARMWLAGGDPYLNRHHIFPYPPIVIRAFLWVKYFAPFTSLKIWVAVLAAILAASAVVAHRTRRKLGLAMPPLTLSVFVVLASYPALFQLERANCDPITLATILVSLPLLDRRGRATDFLAGAILSVGPWVKFYPGLMGFGLVALRRPWAVLGFAAGGAAIFLSMPAETERSFAALKYLMVWTRKISVGDYPTWSHSLSLAWLLIAHELSGRKALSSLKHVSELAVACLIVVAAIAPICFRVFARRDSARLTYPLLVWICAVAACVPIIANDYSLVFYPVAVVACADVRDPWPARLGILASLPFWQPFAFPISGFGLLASKLLGLAGVGVSLWRRAAEAPHSGVVGSS